MLACFIALFVTQTTQPTITYTNFGARTEVVLADLSKITGTKLRAAPNARDIPLTLRLQEAPSSEVLSKIADAIGGRWLDSSNGSTLSFDPNSFAKQEIIRQNRLIDDRLLGLRQWVEDSKSAKTEKEWPTQAAIARLIEQLDWSELTQLAPGQHLLFGEPPRPLIRPFPRVSTQDLKRLKAFYDTEAPIKAEELAQRMICLDFCNRQNEVELTVTLIDKNGQSLIKPVEFRFEPNHAPKSQKEEVETETEDDEPPFKLSDNLNALTAGLDDDKVHSAEVFAHLADPVNYDPSSYLGEYFVHFAELKKSQFVGSVYPDEPTMLDRYDRVNIDGQRLSQDQLESLLWREGAAFSKDWITLVRRSDPKTGLALPPTQRLLKNFLDTIKSITTPTFKDLKTAYQAGFSRVTEQLPVRYLLEDFSLIYESNQSFLNLLSRLSTEEMARLENGGQIPLQSLSQDARAEIVDQLFGISDDLAIEEDTLNKVGIEQDYVYQSTYGLLTKPYECLSSYVPGGAFIKLKHESSPILRLKGDTSFSENLIEINLLVDDPALQNRPAQIGEKETWTFRTFFTNLSESDISGSFYKFPDPRFVSPKDFPESLKKLIAQAKAAMEEQRKKIESQVGLPGGNPSQTP